MEPKYLTIPQLANLLGISRIAVYKKVKAGFIPAQQIGRNFAISEEYIHANLVSIQKSFLSDGEIVDIDGVMAQMMKEHGSVLMQLGRE